MENNFIDMAQVAERKFFFAELERNRGAFHKITNPRNCFSDDSAVIKFEPIWFGKYFNHVHKLCRGSITASEWGREIGVECHERNADCTARAWVASDLAVCTDLYKIILS